MKRQAKSDKKCVKPVKIVASGLLMLSGVLLILTWPAVFDCILFKVSWRAESFLRKLLCNHREEMLKNARTCFSHGRGSGLNWKLFLWPFPEQST